jgi:hypothetical protein
VRVDHLRQSLPDRGREVRHQLTAQVRVVGDIGRNERALEIELGEREEHGELGRREAESGGVTLLERLGPRKPFECAAEDAGLLQPLDLARVYAEELARLDGRDLEGVRLRFVVGENERGHVVGHLGEQRVAIGRRQQSGADGGVEQDLDVHFVVGAVDAGRVVDGVGVHASARSVTGR